MRQKDGPFYAQGGYVIAQVGKNELGIGNASGYSLYSGVVNRK